MAYILMSTIFYKSFLKLLSLELWYLDLAYVKGFKYL